MYESSLRALISAWLKASIYAEMLLSSVSEKKA